ncbi:hypothetical protein SH2C18_19090 [Clostridium sediminicola]|uniref:cupin domain-containing protein n=1 Tax=Clostridium sediminicola TaxID=3114879 RepID=UPI0031F1DDA6
MSDPIPGTSIESPTLNVFPAALGAAICAGVLCLRLMKMNENFFILEGELEFEVDGKIVVCKKGDFIHVAPGEAHYLKNTTDSVAKAAFALSPYQQKDKVDI